MGVRVRWRRKSVYNRVGRCKDAAGGGAGERDCQLWFHLPLVSDIDVCIATIRWLLMGTYIGQMSYKMLSISLSMKQKNH